MTNPPADAGSWEPEDWLASSDPATSHASNEPWSHRGDTSVHEDIVARRPRRDAHHHVMESLAELRRAVGRTQLDVAREWGRPQPKVSRLERQPERAEVATLAGYVAALDGHLTVEVEIDGETYRYELTRGSTGPHSPGCGPAAR